MINDASLKRAVAKYENSNKQYEAILYVCLEGGAEDVMAAVGVGMLVGITLGATVGGGVSGALGALSNDFAILTVNDDCLCFYVLNKFSSSLNIRDRIVLPYEAIVKLKIGKFLVWNNLKVYFKNENKKHKLKVKISDKVVGIKEQKESIKFFLDYLKSKNLKM